MLWRDRRAAGIAHAAVGVGGAWLTGVALRRLVGDGAATVVATAVCVAGRMLDAEATAVGDLLAAGDLPAARERLRSLVGRDDLVARRRPGVARAVVESVAARTRPTPSSRRRCGRRRSARPVSSPTAPSNTLDAMVGHRSARHLRFGWASARLDDVANAVPAVAGVALVMARHPRRWRAIGGPSWSTPAVIRRRTPG